MATYTAVAVRRTPAQAAGPTLTELGPLNAVFTYSDALYEASEGVFVMDVDALGADIKQALRDLAAEPLEVWLYRDSNIVFAGPVLGGDIKDGALTLNCRGLEIYTAYMLVTTDTTYTAQDQHTIAKALVDDWQALDYGDFGIETATVGASGTNRDLFIPGATEPRMVYELLYEFGSVNNGFDWYIDPDTRELTLGTRGNDLSASVFLERGVRSPDIGFAIGPGLLASEVSATGTNSGLETPLTTTVTNATLRASFGRCGFALTADGADTAGLLSDAATAALNDRSGGLFVPGPGLVPVAGAGVDDFGAGDTITYTFDAGLGQQTGSYRIGKRTVSVGSEGQETITVEFE